jgi:hypothetical protein
VVERIARTAAVVCVVLAAAAAIWTREVAAPLGVLGGGLLIGLSYWAIAGTVDALMARSASPEAARPEAARDKIPSESGRKRAGFHLVKIFTRHGMLALAAYVMMVRLHLDPVGLLAGVSSLGIAVAVEVLRDLRWRRFP